MKKLLLISLILLSSLLTSFAQENNTFQVLAAKGNILLNGKSINLKTTLNTSQIIQLSDENSYLTLISKDKKEIIEISKKGSFKINELPKITLASNYEKLVVDALLEPETNDSVTKNRFQYVNKMVQKVGEKIYPIRTFLRSGKNKIFGDKASIIWHLDKNIPYKESVYSYQVRISNLDENIFFEEMTLKKQITFSLSSIKNLSAEQIFVVKIFPLDKYGKELGFLSKTSVDGDAIEKLSEQERKAISQELSEITKLKDTALAKLVEAHFFEDKELYIDALNAYQDALQLSFEAKEVQKIYQFFLERNGFAISE